MCDCEGEGTRIKRTSMVAPRSEYLAALLIRQSRFSVRNCLSVITLGQMLPCGWVGGVDDEG